MQDTQVSKQPEIMCMKKRRSELLNIIHKHGLVKCGWKGAVISSGQVTGLADTEIRTREHTEARVLLRLDGGCGWQCYVETQQLKVSTICS